MSDTFTCASCGETFAMAWADEDAAAEAAALWGDGFVDAVAICDDCFARIMRKTVD